MLKYPCILRNAHEPVNGRGRRRWSTGLFVFSGILVGASIYVYNVREIGFGSFSKMAPLYPFIGLTMYTAVILMVTDSQSDKGKLITAIVSAILTSTGFVTTLCLDY